MIKSKTVKLFFVITAGFLISCGINNSENTSNEVKENLEVILEGITSLDKSIKETKDTQQVISRKITSLEKAVNNLALASKNKPSDKKKPTQADPNKVYNIPVGDSFTKGPKDAAVTIIEWSDFQ